MEVLHKHLSRKTLRSCLVWWRKKRQDATCMEVYWLQNRMHIGGPLGEQESRALIYKLLLWLKYSGNILRALWEVGWDHYGEKFLNPKTPRIPSETHPLASRQGFSTGEQGFYSGQRLPGLTHAFGSHSLEKELFFHWRFLEWWPWSLKLQILRERVPKKSLPGSPYPVNCVHVHFHAPSPPPPPQGSCVLQKAHSAAGRKGLSMEEIPTSSRKQRPLNIASFWSSGAWCRSWPLASSSWEVLSTHEDSAALHHR